MWVASGGLERREDPPGLLSKEERLAAARRNELKRIWTAMSREGWETYSPTIDPEVARWHRAHQERQASGNDAAVEPGPATGSVHIADIRRRERADLMRLERFVREHVLPRTYPHTTQRRRALEALGEAGGLCTARTVNGDGDYIVCTLDTGHYDPDDKPPFKDGKPGGWHKADGTTWNDLGAACTPHVSL
ncbi:hypothetical protein ABZ714_33895 [Streptomyces sp. NPDC006798]|uniref:hypothetical protein n=1 Tax=Streptomyces sp. NPDC006798 TaxID=3155462 RepID=UPI0033C890FB